MYLKKKNGNYSFRFRVPNDLRPLFHRSEFVKSLKTKDIKLARKKSKLLLAEIKLLIEKVYVMAELNIGGVDELVSQWLSDRLDADLRGRINKANVGGCSEDDLPRTKQVDATREFKNNAKTDLANLDIRNIETVAKAVLGCDVDLDNPMHKRLSFQLLRANMNLFTHLTDRNEGIFPFEIGERPKITYGDAVHIFLKHLKLTTTSKPRGYNTEPEQHRIARVFFQEHLLPIVGEDTQVKDRLEVVLDLVADLDLPRDKYKFLKDLFSFLYKNNEISNDIGDLLPPYSKESYIRRAFTPEEIALILSRASGDILELMKLYLLTGMRRTEFFSMTVDHADNFLIPYGKTKNARRTIPRHPQLTITTETIVRIQAQFNPESLGQLLNDFINREVCADREISLHSTRHFFNTALVNAEVNPMVIKALLGHAKDMGNPTERYHSGHNAGMLESAVAKVSLVTSD